MKRIICILLAVVSLASLCSCTDKNDRPIEPINFYYRTRDIQYGTTEDVISFEIRDSFGHTEDYTYLITEYLKGPQTEKCISPFPAGTILIQLDLVKDKVLVVLSSHIALLSGADLVIACTCLARTLHEMTGMKSVQISANGDLLDGKEFIVIQRDDFVTQDDYQPTQPTD